MGSYKTEAAGLTNTAIQQYAGQIGEHYKIHGADGRADIDAFVQELGGRTQYANNEESLDVRRIGEFTIYIPHFTSARRDRFTKAHELGHYFLHYVYAKKSEPMKCGRGGRDRAETEANVFASALLMPEKEFKSSFEELDGDFWKLASRFDVSPLAAEVRAQVLHLT